MKFYTFLIGVLLASFSLGSSLYANYVHGEKSFRIQENSQANINALHHIINKRYVSSNTKDRKIEVPNSDDVKVEKAPVPLGFKCYDLWKERWCIDEKWQLIVQRLH